MLNWLHRLLGRNPLEKPCQCGSEPSVLLSPEKEGFERGVTYCLSCFTPLLERALAESVARWVVVQPFRDAPRYGPLTLTEIEGF